MPLELNHLIAAAAATRLHCEEQEEEKRRSQLGAKASDIDVLATEIMPLLEGARAELAESGISLAIACGYGPGTANERWLQLVCRPMGKWPMGIASNARGHRVTIGCRGGEISVVASPVHIKTDSALERENPDQPLTATVAAQLAVDHAVATLLEDARAKAAPAPTRGMAGDPTLYAPVVLAR